MEIIHGAENFKERSKQQGLVLALGNFDGLHLAHKKIIDRAMEIAEADNLHSAVLLLDPHPYKVLFPQSSFLLLSTISERAGVLDRWGVDYLVVEKFTREFSGISPYKFVQDYLVGLLNVSQLIVGFDYSFGAMGRGTPGDLLKWSGKFGYKVEIIPPVMIGDEVVSSSLIRELVGKGEVTKASHYLGGEHFCRSGRVVRGEGLGRNLGYPTANLDIEPGLLIPGKGVYLTLSVWGGKKYFSLTNIGRKPTFGRSDKILVETHLLDFSGDLYGEVLTVKFLRRIRMEKAFPGASSLVKQIQADEKMARDLIAKEYLHLKTQNSKVTSRNTR